MATGSCCARPGPRWSSAFALELNNTAMPLYELVGANTGRSGGAYIGRDMQGLLDYVKPTGAGGELSVRRRLSGVLAFEVGTAVHTFHVGYNATDGYLPFARTTIVGELHAGIVVGRWR